MSELDLDALRAEATKEPHKVTLAGVVYELNPVFPVRGAELLADQKITEALGTIFGQEQAEEVSKQLGANELDTILREVYHLDEMGEGGDEPTPINRAARRKK